MTDPETHLSDAVARLEALHLAAQRRDRCSTQFTGLSDPINRFPVRPAIHDAAREANLRAIRGALEAGANVTVDTFGRLMKADPGMLLTKIPRELLLQAIKDPDSRFVGQQELSPPVDPIRNWDLYDVFVGCTYIDACIFATEAYDWECRAGVVVPLVLSLIGDLISHGVNMNAVHPRSDGSTLFRVILEVHRYPRARRTHTPYESVSRFLLEKGATLGHMNAEWYHELSSRAGDGMKVLKWYTGTARFDIAGADVLQFFRGANGADHDFLLAHLSHGATGTIVEGRGLGDFAADGQNVHTSLTTATLRKLVVEARKAVGKGTPSPTLQHMSTLFENLTDGELSRIQDDAPKAIGRTLGEIRSALEESLGRFYGDLSNMRYCGVGSGAEAIALVYNCLSIILDPRGALVCVGEALLQAASEYGWQVSSCAQGSISMMLKKLEGRIEPSDAESGGGGEIPADVATYREQVQQQLQQNPQVVHAEANARFVRCDRRRLSDIYEEGFIGGRPEWAENELRGALFDVLLEESADVRAKLRVESDDDDEDDIILPGMNDLISDLAQLSDVFARSLLHAQDVHTRIDVLFASILDDSKEGAKRRRVEDVGGGGEGGGSGQL